jgi:hypothetical protein
MMMMIGTLHRLAVATAAATELIAVSNGQAVLPGC